MEKKLGKNTDKNKEVKKTDKVEEKKTTGGKKLNKKDIKKMEKIKEQYADEPKEEQEY